MLKKRMVVLLSVLLIGVFAMFPGKAPGAAPRYDVDISVSTGLSDMVRFGASAPFGIVLSNRGEEFSGEIQVLVSTDSDSSVVYSTPVNLPGLSTKEIFMNVPIYTSVRKAEIKLMKGDKEIKGTEYEFKKLIAPNVPTIGIISDDKGSLRELNGMKLEENRNAADQEAMKKAMVSVAALGTVAGADVPAEVIELDGKNLPYDQGVLNNFDVLVINNFDSSVLTQKANDALEEWVDAGHTLFIGTGPNWKKVYSGLRESMKPFKIEGASGIPSPQVLGKLAGTGSPSGMLNIATGSAESGSVLAEEEGIPLAVVYGKGSGNIAVLAYDPTISPIAGWDGSQALWRNMVNDVRRGGNGGNPILVSSSSPYMNLQYLASKVPEDKNPPFTFLLVVIGIYILFIGPVLYALLKWKDKRDWNWVFVPAAAVAFMLLIYLAGFRTRYNTAVLNNVSVINLNSAANRAEITTTIGAFNNKNGSMAIENGDEKGIDVNINRVYQSSYSYVPPQGVDVRTAAVITFSEHTRYELFDTQMWYPRYIGANKNVPIQGSAINSVSLEGGRFKAVIRNTTGYVLKEAFISVGNNFIEVGDLDPGQEKNIDVDLEGQDVIKNYEDFLNGRYGQAGYNTGKALPPDWMEKNNKRSLIDNVYTGISNSLDNIGRANVLLVALNYDDPGYDLKINDKEPDKFNSNIVYSVSSLYFEKGRKVDIPAGILKATMLDSSIARYEDISNGGIRVDSSGEVPFKIMLPRNIEFDGFKLNWSPYIPTYMKAQTKGSQQTFSNNTYKFYIYNSRSRYWEEIPGDFAPAGNTGDYINDRDEISLKAIASIEKPGMQGILLGTPVIEASGVVK